MQTGQPAAATVVPLMRYRDPAAAIDWLCRAFGFDRHFVVGGEEGRVVYAQLTAGKGMVMLGPVGDGALDTHLKQPDEIGGIATQSCYIFVDDIAAHYERARAAGADIVVDLEGGAFGARGYSARDLEGHIWSFGSYDPWRGKRQPRSDAPGEAKSSRRGLVRDASVLGLCLAALGAAVFFVGQDLQLPRVAVGVPAGESPELANAAGSLARAEAALSEAERRRGDAEAAAADANRKLAEKEAHRLAAETAFAALTADLERERALRLGAEKEASAAAKRAADRDQDEIDGDKKIRAELEARAAAAEADLEALRAAKAEVERSAAELQERLAVEARAREAAEAERRRALEELEQARERAAAPPVAPSTGPVSTGSTGSGRTSPEEATSAPQADSGSNPPPTQGPKVRAWQKALPARRVVVLPKPKEKSQSSQKKQAVESKKSKPSQPKAAKAKKPAVPLAPPLNVL